MTDPASFLHSLIAKKGKSDLIGCYVTQVTATADTHEVYDYPYEDSASESEVLDEIRKNRSLDWNRFLVNCRMEESEIIQTITFCLGGQEISLQVFLEGSEISAQVCVPKLNVVSSVYWVTYFQHLMKFLGKFTGKTPTTIRFCVGLAVMYWDDMVDQGNASEQDVAF